MSKKDGKTFEFTRAASAIDTTRQPRSYEATRLVA